MPGLLDFIRDPESQKRVGRGLLDAANRGLVANTLGGPVDMATALANLGVAGVGYAGHKAGLLKTPPDLIDPATVPGSSEWIGKKMERAGMVSQDRNPVAEAGFSMLAPVAYKGAQKAGGLLFNAEQRAAQNLAQPSTMQMQGQRGAVYVGRQKVANNAYHGTGRDFSRFSPDEIGSSNANLGDAYWLTDDYAHARGYAQQASGSKTGNIVKEANVFLRNPMTVDAMQAAGSVADDVGVPRPNDWDEASELLGYTDWVRDMIRSARVAGHDALIIKNTGDAPGTAGGLSDHYAVFNPSRVRFKR